jgi:hypothetical protein
MPRSRRVSIMLAGLLLLYGLAEITAYLGLRFLESKGKQGYAPTLTSEVSEAHRDILGRVINGEAKYIGYSRDLGWTTLPHGANELYRANSQGARGTREYASAPPQDGLRIAAFGDSFVHGDDVPNSAAWSIIMEQKAAGIEVMNFGVGGYGPDQGYLRYLNEGRTFSPHIVFIGYQTENINRVVNVFRPFYSPNTGNPLAKPYFQLVDGGAVLNENPIGNLSDYRRLLDDPANILGPMGEDDFHYKFRYKRGPLDWSPAMRLVKVLYFEYRSRFLNPLFQGGQYRTSSEAYQLLFAIIEDFHCDVVMNGSLPVVVLFPHRADLAALSRSESLQYEPLKDQLLAAGHPVIDLAEAFRPLIGETGLNELIQAHYTGRGNEAIADFLLAEIDTAGLFSRGRRNELMTVQRRLCRP